MASQNTAALGALAEAQSPGAGTQSAGAQAGGALAAQGHASGSTTLHGRIEAIGIHDLLRISVSRQSTGRLLVFNDRQDAEIYYEEGRLVAAVSGSIAGEECLSQALQMNDGEFEFAWGLLATPDQKTPALHEAMLLAVKQFYESRVTNRQSAGAQNAQGERRLSGVHKVAPVDTSSTAAVTPAAVTIIAPQAPAPQHTVPRPTPPDRAQLPQQHSPTPSSPTPSSPTQPLTAEPQAPAAQNTASPPVTSPPGELGSATVDPNGRVLQRSGALSQQDAALAALIFKLSGSLGSPLGMRDLRRFELSSPGDKTLACAISGGELRLAKTSPETDLDTVWKRLEK